MCTEESQWLIRNQTSQAVCPSKRITAGPMRLKRPLLNIDVRTLASGSSGISRKRVSAGGPNQTQTQQPQWGAHGPKDQDEVRKDLTLGEGRVN